MHLIMRVQVYIIIFLAILFNSCASIINTPYVDVRIDTDADSAKLYMDQSNQSYSLPTTVSLERLKEDLIVSISDDSISKEYKLNSRLSASFWLGNLLMDQA
jgi:hypothetical protein